MQFPYHGDSFAFPQHEQTTQLCYRGVPYQPKTFVTEASMTVQTGCYRGGSYPIKCFHIQSHSKPIQMRYRGAFIKNSYC